VEPIRPSDGDPGRLDIAIVRALGFFVPQLKPPWGRLQTAGRAV